MTSIYGYIPLGLTIRYRICSSAKLELLCFTAHFLFAYTQHSCRATKDFGAVAATSLLTRLRNA